MAKLIVVLFMLAFVVLIFIIYMFYKWLDEATKTISRLNERLCDQEKKLSDLIFKVDVYERTKYYYRTDNISYNEEGIGSINPSEADTA